jgi:hypothetical protein
MEGIETPQPLWQVEPSQASRRKIIADHRLGHVAPTDTSQK